MGKQSKHEYFDFMMRFWRGKLPVDGTFFARSLLTLLILYEIQVISHFYLSLVGGSIFIPVITKLLIFLATLLICIWLVVGALRSMKTSENSNAISKARYVYGGGLIVSIGIYVFSMKLYYMVYLFMPMDGYVHIAIHGESKSFDKSIVSRISDETIEINGVFQIGLTKEVMKYFENYPNIKNVKLNSIGGSASEGNKLHALLKTKSVTTYTTTNCASACTLVFMAGKKRLMVGKGKLGFHSASNVDIRKVKDTEIELLINVLNFRMVRTETYP